MFDPKRLLGQLIASQVQKKLGGGHAGRHGYGSPHGGDLAGLAGLVLGSKGGRRLGGSAGKLGGMALVGSLAYQAYRSWQESQGQDRRAPPRSAGGSFLGSASGSPWNSQGT